jgi:hypothetical protein
MHFLNCLLMQEGARETSEETVRRYRRWVRPTAEAPGAGSGGACPTSGHATACTHAMPANVVHSPRIHPRPLPLLLPSHDGRLGLVVCSSSFTWIAVGPEERSRYTTFGQVRPCEAAPYTCTYSTRVLLVSSQQRNATLPAVRARRFISPRHEHAPPI